MKETARDTHDFQSDAVTKVVTRIVNGGTKKLAERQKAKKTIGKLFVSRYGACK